MYIGYLKSGYDATKKVRVTEKIPEQIGWRKAAIWKIELALRHDEL